MDEVFGYENFRSEVVWQRTSSHTILTTMASTTTPSSTTEMAAHPTGATQRDPQSQNTSMPMILSETTMEKV